MERGRGLPGYLALVFHFHRLLALPLHARVLGVGLCTSHVISAARSREPS